MRGLRLHPKEIVPYSRQYFDSVSFIRLPMLVLPSTLPPGSVLEHDWLKPHDMPSATMFTFGETIPCPEDLLMITKELAEQMKDGAHSVAIIVIEDGRSSERIYSLDKVCIFLRICRLPLTITL